MADGLSKLGFLRPSLRAKIRAHASPHLHRIMCSVLHLSRFAGSISFCRLRIWNLSIWTSAVIQNCTTVFSWVWDVLTGHEAVPGLKCRLSESFRCPFFLAKCTSLWSPSIPFNNRSTIARTPVLETVSLLRSQKCLGMLFLSASLVDVCLDWTAAIDSPAHWYCTKAFHGKSIPPWMVLRHWWYQDDWSTLVAVCLASYSQST